MKVRFLFQSLSGWRFPKGHEHDYDLLDFIMEIPEKSESDFKQLVELMFEHDPDYDGVELEIIENKKDK